MMTTELRNKVYKLAKESYLAFIVEVQNMSKLPFIQGYPLLRGDMNNEFDGSPYLCDNCRRAVTHLRQDGWTITPEDVDFPELKSFQPSGSSFNWWPEVDCVTRLEVLDKCIAMTANSSHGYTEGADIWPEFPPKETNHIK